MRRAASSIAVGGVLTGLGLAAGALAMTIPIEANGDAGARFFPSIASGALVVLGLLELRQGSRDRGVSRLSGDGPTVGATADAGVDPARLAIGDPTADGTHGSAHGSEDTTGGRVRVLALLALAILYAWLVGKLGYVVPTGIAAALAMALFGLRRPLPLLVAALVCPVAYHLVFFEALGVFPPFGEWFDPLDWWRAR